MGRVVAKVGWLWVGIGCEKGRVMGGKRGRVLGGKMGGFWVGKWEGYGW